MEKVSEWFMINETENCVLHVQICSSAIGGCEDCDCRCQSSDTCCTAASRDVLATDNNIVLPNWSRRYCVVREERACLAVKGSGAYNLVHLAFWLMRVDTGRVGNVKAP